MTGLYATTVIKKTVNLICDLFFLLTFPLLFWLYLILHGKMHILILLISILITYVTFFVDLLIHLENFRVVQKISPEAGLRRVRILTNTNDPTN